MVIERFLVRTACLLLPTALLFELVRYESQRRAICHTDCLVEHIGSLLRPDELVKKRYAVADKSATPDELVPVEQKAIKEVVKLEQECGIHSITNGEYSRHQFWGASKDSCRGAELS